MRQLLSFIVLVSLLESCGTSHQLAGSTAYQGGDTLITQSLFDDKASTISEENVQKILNGNYRLPQSLRIAIVRVESAPGQRRHYHYYSDEQYLNTRQSYLDLFMEKFGQSPRVARISNIPDMLVPSSPSFTNIREAAVKLQADIVVIYSITSDIYSKYKFFSRPVIKAFVTTQLIVLDVRTGLIPFSTVVTKDVLSQKKKEELNNSEALSRIQNQAALLTIDNIGQKITAFLNER